MRYLIHDGGNALQHPWSVQTSGRVGSYRVNYAEHHKRRTLEIGKHIDTQSEIWNGFDYSIHGESDDKPIRLADNDELVTHIFGQGSIIDYIVFHVKRAGSGTITPFVEQDDGTRLDILDASGAKLEIDLSKVGHYYGVVPAVAESAGDDSDGGGEKAAAAEPQKVPITLTLADFQVNGETVSGVTATGEITLPASDSAGTAESGSASGGKPMPYMTTDNGVIGFSFTAEKDDDDAALPFDTCMGIYFAVKDFWDEVQCECAPAPCETEYPPALCTPNRKPKDK